MLKLPGWEWSIVWYFFCGGIAGGAYFTAAIADNFGSARDARVARIGYLLSLPLVAVCGALLVYDLGVPARFLNMLRTLKFWDPMSIGAWALGVFGAFTFVSSALSFSGSPGLQQLRRRLGLVGMLFGFFLASYTGVLLSNTALPFWGDARLMGALFLASGGSTGMAGVVLLMFLTGEVGGESWHKVASADRYSIVIEILVLAAFLLLLGSAAAPMTRGPMAPLFWIGLVGLGLLVPLVINVIAHRVKPLVFVSAVLVLIGGFVLRYVVVMSLHA